MNLHAQIIEEDGKPKFAMLPIEDYEMLVNELSDFDTVEDLVDQLKALKIKADNNTWHSLEDVKAQLGIE